MLRLFSPSVVNPAECIAQARVAADGAKVGKARRLLEQALAADPTRMDTVVRCAAQTPSLNLYKTFVKKALNDPQMLEPLRCRHLAWDLAFAGQALQTRTDYTPYYNRVGLPLSPRQVLAPFAGEAPTFVDCTPSAQGCLVALRAGFLRRNCREIQRAGYDFDEETLGAEQAALHHVLTDVLGDMQQAAEVVRKLSPTVLQRAVVAAVRWGDTEGLVHLLNAGAPCVGTPELAALLLAIPEAEKRLQWLRLDSRLSENDRRDFVVAQNITCLLALLDHGLDVSVMAAAMIEQPQINGKILQILLARGLDANFVHPESGATLALRALYTRNFAAVRVLKAHAANSEGLAKAVLRDWQSVV